MTPTKLTTIDLEKKDTTIAQELEDRLWYLADPDVVWVDHYPTRRQQACLVVNGNDRTYRITRHNKTAITLKAKRWLDEFVQNYAASSGWNFFGSVIFNDDYAKSREEVLWMLEEAIDQAKWEGV